MNKTGIALTALLVASVLLFAVITWRNVREHRRLKALERSIPWRTFVMKIIVYRWYADMLQKHPNQLTDSERRQAFLAYMLSEEARRE